MKKTFPKKLSLSRETIRGLDAVALGQVAGGITTQCDGGTGANSCDPETYACREPSMLAISKCISACTTC